MFCMAVLTGEYRTATVLRAPSSGRALRGRGSREGWWRGPGPQHLLGSWVGGGCGRELSCASMAQMCVPGRTRSRGTVRLASASGGSGARRAIQDLYQDVRLCVNRGEWVKGELKVKLAHEEAGAQISLDFIPSDEAQEACELSLSHWPGGGGGGRRRRGRRRAQDQGAGQGSGQAAVLEPARAPAARSPRAHTLFSRAVLGTRRARYRFLSPTHHLPAPTRYQTRAPPP